MKHTLAIGAILAILSAIPCAFSGLPTEFISKNPDGSIKTRGIYSRDSDGKVTRFDVSNAQGDPLYSEIPYYSEDGRIIRVDRLTSSGSLQQVVVYLEDKAIVLDSSGQLIETQAFSQKDFLASLPSRKPAEQDAAANP